MKKLIILSTLMLFTAFGFSQIRFQVGEAKPTITLKSDTLFVPVGTCNYIKIGDKVYKVKVELEEVPEPNKGILLYNGGRLTLPYTVPSTVTPNSTFLLNNATNTPAINDR